MMIPFVLSVWFLCICVPAWSLLCLIWFWYLCDWLGLCSSVLLVCCLCRISLCLCPNRPFPNMVRSLMCVLFYRPIIPSCHDYPQRCCDHLAIITLFSVTRIPCVFPVIEKESESHCVVPRWSSPRFIRVVVFGLILERVFCVLWF